MSDDINQEIGALKEAKEMHHKWLERMEDRLATTNKTILELVANIHKRIDKMTHLWIWMLVIGLVQLGAFAGTLLVLFLKGKL